MKKRLVNESASNFPGFQLKQEESVLFRAHTTKRIRNPWDNYSKHFETVILTNTRLTALSMVGATSGQEAVTTIPLKKVDSIQYTYLGWTPLRVVACIFGFLWYIVPGVIYLVYMERNKGPRVDVVSGALRLEMKFDEDNPHLLNRFIQLFESSLA